MAIDLHDFGLDVQRKGDAGQRTRHLIIGIADMIAGTRGDPALIQALCNDLRAFADHLSTMVREDPAQPGADGDDGAPAPVADAPNTAGGPPAATVPTELAQQQSEGRDPGAVDWAPQPEGARDNPMPAAVPTDQIGRTEPVGG
jgi:hypothetical protein